MALPAVLVELKASTAEFTTKMDEAKAKTAELGDGGKANVDKLAGALQGLAIGAGAGAIAFGAFSLDQADKLETAQSHLQTAVTNAGGSWDDYSKQIHSAGQNMEDLGFTHAEFEDALAKAVTATQDPTKALGEMGIAADIARARNISLADATDLVDKAQTGNLRALKQMGIDLPIAASSAEKLQVASDALGTKTDDLNKFLLANPDAVNASSSAHAEYEKKLLAVHDAQKKVDDESKAGGDIMAALGQRFDGVASNQADTFGGKIKAIETKVQDFGASVGMWLIPKLEEFGSWCADWWQNNGPAVMNVIDKIVDGFKTFAGIVESAVKPILGYLQDHWDQLKIVLMVVGGIIGGLMLVSFTLLAIAVGAFVLIIVAVVAVLTALVQAFQWVWDHTKGVRDIMGDLVGFITGTAIPFITNLAQIVGGFLVGAFQTWLSFVEGIPDFFKSVFDNIVSIVSNVWQWFLDLPGNLLTWGSNLLDMIISPFKSAFNWVAKAWNDTVGSLSFSIPDWVPGIGGDTFSMPTMPILTMHTGGIVPGRPGQEVPALLMAGERVTPVGGDTGMSGPISVTIPLVLDGRQIAVATAEFTQAELLKQSRRNPSLGLT